MIKRTIRRTVLTLVTVGVACSSCCHSHRSIWHVDSDPRLAAMPSRGIDGGGLRSSDSPRMMLVAASGLDFRGTVRFVLRETALVERWHFAQTDPAGRVQRLLIVQFEQILGTSDVRYNYRPRDPTTISGQVWYHNTFFFSNNAAVRESPDAEAARTTRMLTAAGVRLDDELLMSRFVRVVDPECTKEVIISYVEPALSQSVRLSDFEPEGRMFPMRESFDSSLKQRAVAAFELINAVNACPGDP